MKTEFQVNQIRKGSVHRTNDTGYQLWLEASNKKDYSLAQIDDYVHLPRYKFPHKPPIKLTLEARLSDQNLSGTWGFGFWNDPFGMGMGGGGMARILPVMPNAAWFFFGSNENMLTLREDQPGNGFHVKTFRSPLLPSFASLLGIPLAPLILLPTVARRLRHLGRDFIKEDGRKLDVDLKSWHDYELNWDKGQVDFHVDNHLVFSTETVPNGRLGIVIWIDNQYFCFDKSGKLDFGCLEIPIDQWMKISKLNVSQKS